MVTIITNKNINQLTVHTGKTEAMILKTNGFIGPLRPIMFGNALIKYVADSTCLGIVIDNRLTWTKHHEKVMKSFSAKVKELKELAQNSSRANTL